MYSRRNAHFQTIHSEVVQYKIQAVASNTTYLIALCLERLELPAGRRMPARASYRTFAQLMGGDSDEQSVTTMNGPWQPYLTDRKVTSTGAKDSYR